MYQASITEIKARLATGDKANNATNSQARPEVAAKHLAADTNHSLKYQVQVSTVETKEASVCLPIGSVAAGLLAADELQPRQLTILLFSFSPHHILPHSPSLSLPLIKPSRQSWSVPLP